MSGHTCDECGTSGSLDRHHERHDPDVIRLLCPPCHMREHVIRGQNPSSDLFRTTAGMTLREARAVRVIAAVRDVTPSDLCRDTELGEIVAEFGRLCSSEAA